MKGVTRAMNVSVVNRLRSKAEDVLRDRKLIIKVVTVIVIIIAALILRAHESAKSDITVETPDETLPVDEIYVDIGGAVAKPGVYKASTDTRLFEIIEMAGGLRSDADTNSINQASFVEDGEKIIIPVHKAQTEGNEEAESDALYTGEYAEEQSDGSQGLVNINTASKSELMTLSGIGEVMADRIIEYRNSSRFKSIEDIRSVKGIGEATFEKIRDSITV